MRQALLPLIPDGATRINEFLSVVRENGEWMYYLGVRPVFAHDEQDHASFRMYTAQLIDQGSCQQSEIVRAFGVSANSVKRSVKKFRAQGVTASISHVAAEERRCSPRRWLAKRKSGCTAASRVAKSLNNWASSSIRSAKPSFRDACPNRKSSRPPHCRLATGPSPPVTTKRHRRPSQRPKGRAAIAPSGRVHHPRYPSPTSPSGPSKTSPRLTVWAWPARLLDRVAASLGLLPGGAATQFEPCRDVAFGGVLCALPALAQNGLFRHLEACFTSLGGYYTTLQVMTLLGYLALCRVKTVEQLQYQPPANWESYSAWTACPKCGACGTNSKR